jgi:dTDP-4-amino-4,6-dideoxygalactose transaminase
LRDEFLIFGRPVIGQEEIDEVVDSLRSRWIGTGPKVQRFERMLEEYVACEHVRCVHSCTAALILSMEVLGVGPGDEVIVPAMTFVASANAVVHTGADVVLVDCEPGTALIDLDAAEAAITPRTKAIMPVHFAGRPVDLDRVGELARRHDLLVVEDAAHAIGAEWRGRRIGAHGNVACFSFYATKNITTIEGGAIATSDPKVAEQVERLALHGLSLGAWQRFSDAGFKHYEAMQPGYKFNLTDVQASLGLHQLRRLDGWLAVRDRLFQRYDQLLADLPVETPPPASADMRHARHLYQVLVPPEVDRDAVLGAMTRQRIGTGVHYRGVHLHPYYAERYDVAPQSLPVATDISNRTISLPLQADMTAADQDDVVEALRVALRAPARAD